MGRAFRRKHKKIMLRATTHSIRKDHNLKPTKYSLCYSITHSVIFCKGGKGVKMKNDTYLTIRQVAATGILSEHAIRIMEKQGKIPCLKIGKKTMINFPLFLETLNCESKRAVQI